MRDEYFKVETLEIQTKDRAQKIVAALYLLTNHIDPENPIRTEIRTSATNLLKAVLFNSKIDLLKNSISSFLSVALLTKDISIENISIIEEELKILKVDHNHLSEPILSQMFQQEKETVLVGLKETNNTKQSFSIGQTQQSLKANSSHLSDGSQERENHSTQKPKTLETDKRDTLSTKNEESVFNRKDDKKVRRVRVLELLSKTELKTIKDVSKFFTDCSEKTIQRELNDLVDEKRIIRVGDRRWSTYKLA